MTSPSSLPRRRHLGAGPGAGPGTRFPRVGRRPRGLRRPLAPRGLDSGPLVVVDLPRVGVPRPVASWEGTRSQEVGPECRTAVGPIRGTLGVRVTTRPVRVARREELTMTTAQNAIVVGISADGSDSALAFAVAEASRTRLPAAPGPRAHDACRTRVRRPVRRSQGERRRDSCRSDGDGERTCRHRHRRDRRGRGRRLDRRDLVRGSTGHPLLVLQHRALDGRPSAVRRLHRAQRGRPLPRAGRVGARGLGPSHGQAKSGDRGRPGRGRGASFAPHRVRGGDVEGHPWS